MVRRACSARAKVPRRQYYASGPKLFQDGDLSALLAGLQPTEDGAPPQHLPPRVPGQLTQADCRRLLQAGKQGRLTTAWKQLQSYGLAGSNPQTETMLREKWVPAPLFPEAIQSGAIMRAPPLRTTSSRSMPSKPRRAS